MESSIARLRSALQCVHLTRSAGKGDISASVSQALHLKCIIGGMKAFFLMFFAAVFLFPAGPTTLQAQSLADFARQERERQAHLKPAQVITGRGSGATASLAAQSALPKPEEAKKPLADPVKEYNDRIAKLRTSIRSLQDEDTATQLQINQLNNEVYAPVVDQAAKDQALTVVAAAQQKLANVRMELEATRKELEALEAQGPPKVSK
jgi:hypothetical protein